MGDNAGPLSDAPTRRKLEIPGKKKEVAARYPEHPLLPVLRDRLATLDALSQKLAGPH